MNITYGDGEVLVSGDIKGFQIAYTGVVVITEKSDDIFMSANDSRIIGISLVAGSMPKSLFKYKGDLKISSCKIVTIDSEYIKAKLKTQGVDTWGLDKEVWEDDGSRWGTSNKKYLVGSKQVFNKKSIVVNNNIKVGYDGQYLYKDGSPVLKDSLIHIHSDGTAMTGGVKDKNSVIIYHSMSAKPLTKKQIRTVISNKRSSRDLNGGKY